MQKERKLKVNQYVYLAIVMLFMTRFGYGQKVNDDVIENLDKKILLEKLFDSPIIDNQNIAIWQPNYYESLNFNLSYDEKCHTSIDTILYFRDIKNRECSLVVFKTMTYGPNELKNNEIEVYGCHFCNATISVALLYKNENSKWVIYGFEKHLFDSGLFGGIGKEGIGKASINKIKEESFLSFKKPIEGNAGEIKGAEILFSIDNFSKLGCEPLADLFYSIYYSEINGKIIKNEILFKESNLDKIVVKKIDKNKSVAKFFSYSDVFGMFINTK